MANAVKISRKQSRSRAIAGAVLVLLILLLFGLGVVLFNVVRPAGVPKRGAISAGMTWVRSIYGFGSRPDQQLLEPLGVAVDSQGRIYVTEPQRSRVVVFTRDGGFAGVITLMKSHDVSMIRPVGIDVDAAGNLYVADKDLHRVIVFGPDRQFVRNIDDDVTGVKVIDDRLYAIGRDHVSIYTLKGELLNRFGKAGRGPGQFDGAYALALGQDKNLYVADSFNKRVDVFTPKGDYIRSIGRPAGSLAASGSSATSSTDASAPVFDLPTGLVVDGNGRFVALDAFQFQLIVFDGKGKAISTYGDQGGGDGQFIYPSGLAYDQNSDVFVVSDTRNNRVQIVRLEGSGSARLDRLLPAAFFQPICYGPLLLLLLAVVLTAVLARRRRNAVVEEPQQVDAEE